jgi:uncharacterized protein YkwD
MFRKYWQTLKFFIIISAILFSLPRSILPIQNKSPEPGDLSSYLELNRVETRLSEFKDNEEALKLKLIQLEVINRSRRKFRAAPLKLDILASRVANMMSREAAEKEYTGHWNLKGEKPYHRYAFAGGHDHITENAYGAWTTGKYVKSSQTITEMMRSGHNSFMAEKPPADGHKKAIIDKSHNYVGIGYHLTENQFRYYEEFINRYFEFGNIPSKLNVNEQGNLNFSTDGRNFPYFLIIYREALPKPMSVSQLKGKGSYSDFTNEEYLSMPAWEIAGFKKGSQYNIPLKFTKEGLYYIQIYVWKDEITSPTRLDTQGKTPGSGIVIKVEN